LIGPGLAAVLALVACSSTSKSAGTQAESSAAAEATHTSVAPSVTTSVTTPAEPSTAATVPPTATGGPTTNAAASPTAASIDACRLVTPEQVAQLGFSGQGTARTINFANEGVPAFDVHDCFWGVEGNVRTGFDVFYSDPLPDSSITVLKQGFISGGYTPVTIAGGDAFIDSAHFETFKGHTLVAVRHRVSDTGVLVRVGSTVAALVPSS
jgi:hypothetical protein